jgi:hypothetical protein
MRFSSFRNLIVRPSWTPQDVPSIAILTTLRGKAAWTAVWMALCSAHQARMSASLPPRWSVRSTSFSWA